MKYLQLDIKQLLTINHSLYYHFCYAPAKGNRTLSVPLVHLALISAFYF